MRNGRSLIATLTLLIALIATTSTNARDENAQSATRASAANANPSQRDSTTPSKDDIQALIRELGRPRYTARRAAANELHRIGADAFDLLFTATDDADPEVAASARYLLRQITVRWVQNDDPASVRRLLRNYGEATDDARLRTVAQLSRLANREALAALCRVVRYDRSPLVSRVAALAVIRPDLSDSRRSPVDPDAIDRELGESTRTAAKWLRLFQAQLRDPAAAVTEWQRVLDEEAARLARNTDETKAEIQVGLLWNLADIYRQTGDKPGLTQTVDRLVRLDGDDPERVAVAVLMWLVEEKAWDAVDDLLAKHNDRFAKSKRPLYFAALARAQQGKSEAADQLAEQAARLDSSSLLDGFWMAKELEIRDQFDWAVREYRRAIDNHPLGSHEAMLSRVSLASLLHDHQAEKEAADLLEPLVNGLQSDGNVAQMYIELSRYMLRNYDTDLLERDELAAQFHFYRACQYAAEKDWQRQRDSLQTAIRIDKSDADVLIAMYRVPESDEKWRADVRQRIADLARDFQQQIDSSPNESHAYNQWAWLVSNTEGDFQKAIRYSQKSLELNTAGESAAASYLDTLGRCYYAAGDYENAIKHQRLAIEKVSYQKVMHRQLELFEKALADKKAH